MMELQERDKDLSSEEQDNLKHSTKKIKTQEESTTVDSVQVAEHEESSPRPMEENKLIGINGRDKDLFVEEDEVTVDDLSEDEPEVDTNRGDDFLCPELLISKAERLELQKEWKLSLIVKTLGKSMAYRFLKGRLERMWQRKGIIRVIDIGSRFEVFNVEESVDMDIDKAIEIKDQVNSDVVTGDSGLAGTNLHLEVKQKGTKGKQRKSDVQGLESKKQISQNEIPIQGRKPMKGTDKSQEHTLVTSVGTKNLTTQGNKTPIKSTDSNPKAPTKHPTANLKGRAEKDAQMEEQLRAMRIVEKQIREAALYCRDSTLPVAEDFIRECGQDQESPIHALRDCPTVLPLWKAKVRSDAWNRFCTLDVKDWIKLNLTNNLSNARGINWNCFFSITMWSIWKQRNESVFNGTQSSALSLSPSIKAQYKDFMNVTSLKHRLPLNQCPLDRPEPSWAPPGIGWYKINVDGSFKDESNDITCGGVIRDHEGKWIGGFMKKLGKGNILLAEICGILEGLQVAWHKNLKRIVIESDCLEAVSCVSACLDMKHPLYHILYKIKSLLANDWEVKVVHISRDSNKVANILALRAHVLDFGMHLYDDPPACCVELFRDDSRKVPFPAVSGC
ncbi:hypothetical protein G2W53_012361 [Senna tora]|uniref:RNase H type-1 domain-containing protein n=1 Tax=Senna tora TaxID=362788 RepID=A0A834WQK5_9FABA|nr:hypothetical protein G2W53_012361 [Senna tora]